MKIHLTLFSTFLLNILVFSQNLEINKGELYYGDSYTRESDILAEKDGLIYTCQYSVIKRSKRKPNALIHTLDKDLNVIATKEIFSLRRNDVIVKLFYTNNKFHVFFERIVSADYTSTLFVSELNEDGTISSNIKAIAKVHALTSKTFSIRLSTDSTNYIVECYDNYRSSAITIGKSAKYRLHLIHINMDLEIVKTINSNHIFSDSYFQSYLYTEDGTLFYIKFDSLFINSPTNEDIAEIQLPKFDSLVFLDQKMIYDPNRNLLYIAGLLTEPLSRKLRPASNTFTLYSTSYYWIKIDCKTNEVLESKNQTYSEEILNTFSKNENSRLNNKFWMSQLSKIDLDNHGNLTLNLRHLERKDIANGNTSQVLWRSKGALILNLDGKGEILWYQSINLYQTLNSLKTFIEYSKWIGDKFLFVYSNFLDNDHKLVASYLNDRGQIVSSTEENLENNQYVFLHQKNFALNDRIVLSAFEKDGLFKSNLFFLELSY